jgi:DNA-binding CsgD family transcriptional regulator/PAS domain-containing protein
VEDVVCCYQAFMGDSLNLVGLIYEAAFDTARWYLFLDAYVESVGARLGVMIVNLDHGRKNAIFRSSNWPNESFDPPLQRIMADGWYQTLGKGQPEGAIRTFGDLYQPKQFPDSTYSRESGTLEDLYCGVSGVFLRTKYGPSTIVAMRTHQDGPFDVSALTTLRPLMPHLRRAALLQNEITFVRLQLAVFSLFLNRHPYPIVLSDAAGAVIYANAAAKEIASQEDGFSLRSGRISLTSLHNQPTFMKALAEVATGRNGQLRWLEIARPSNERAFRVLLLSVPHCDLTPADGFQAEDGLAIILMVDTGPGQELDPGILRALFSLTGAEARVASRLAAGWRAEEIADEMGISLETVRTHIRHILSKTSTGRQGEFISLVLRTTPFHRFEK